MASVRRRVAATTPASVAEALDSLLRHVASQHSPDFLAVDLTMAQAKVLHVLALRSGIAMSVVAGQLGVSPSAISGLVDRLVDHGYVDRQEDPADRRQQLVSLTPAGRDALECLRQSSASHIRPLLERLTRSELEALQRSLRALDREAQRTLGPKPDSDDPKPDSDDPRPGRDVPGPAAHERTST